jgi:putative nucleotidyltransferase with HDIG domain
MAFGPRELVSAVTHLVSLPEIAMRVKDMADDTRYSAADIGNVISQDPALTAQLLKIANSPYFGFPSEIDNVPRAITIIGTQELRELVLATAAMNVLSRLPNELVSIETFWRHSLRTAVIARTLARYLQEQNIERYFVSGLLHDIGYLVIYRELPELAQKTLQHVSQNRDIVFIVEQEIIGFDHAAVGGELLRLWNLPPAQIEAVQYHHTPSKAKNYPKEAAIIHLANYLANNMLANIDGDMDTPALELNTLQLLGVHPDALQELLQEAEKQFADTVELLIYDVAA